MRAKPPSYPRVVTRPRAERPFVLVNEYGFKVADYTELAAATDALERYPFRGTTFGAWWKERHA